MVAEEQTEKNAVEDRQGKGKGEPCFLFDC